MEHLHQFLQIHLRFRSPVPRGTATSPQDSPRVHQARLQPSPSRAEFLDVAQDTALLEQTLERLEAAERDLSSLREAVRQTDVLATIGGLAAGLAHELNNLLTPALGYASLAERSPDNRDLVSKALRRTIESIETATRLLDATMDLAQPGGCHSNESCSVERAIELALNCLVRSPEQDSIALEQCIDDDAVASIRPQELQQIFVNLLTNACRVLRRKSGGTIRIEAHRISATANAGQPTHDRVRITIDDDGPGIPATIRTSIFQPFTTTEAPTAGDPQQGGRGLGLMICERTITGRQGTIAAEDSPLGGARFTVELPAADDASSSSHGDRAAA